MPGSRIEFVEPGTLGSAACVQQARDLPEGLAGQGRLRQVEEENRTLKQLVADLSLDKHMLQEALRNNG